MKLRLTHLFVICVLVLTSCKAFASGIRQVSEQYIMNIAVNVCVVEVLKVDTKENIQQFNDASSRRISTSLKMKVNPIESLKGKCGNEQFTTTYTTPITATFDNDGHVEKRYTILKLNTGLELDVEVGQRYILSYLSWDEDLNNQRHQRVNHIKDKTRLMTLIAEH